MSWVTCIISDGSLNPFRVKIKSPCFTALAVLPVISRERDDHQAYHRSDRQHRHCHGGVGSIAFALFVIPAAGMAGDNPFGIIEHQDQSFIWKLSWKLLNDNVVGYGNLPSPLQYFLPMLLACLCCMALVALFPIVAVYAERKVAAHMQDRLGPMRVGGWHGWAQTIADGLKLLLKEDIVPTEADPFLFKLAPLVVFVGGFASLVVLPFGASMIVSDLNIGVLYVVAISSPVSSESHGGLGLTTSMRSSGEGAAAHLSATNSAVAFSP